MGPPLLSAARRGEIDNNYGLQSRYRFVADYPHPPAGGSVDGTSWRRRWRAPQSSTAAFSRDSCPSTSTKVSVVTLTPRTGRACTSDKIMSVICSGLRQALLTLCFWDTGVLKLIAWNSRGSTCRSRGSTTLSPNEPVSNPSMPRSTIERREFKLRGMMRRRREIERA